MSGITNPAEEYFKDGLWAWNPVGKVWLKLIIDPLTNQLSVAVNNDVEVHQTTPADLTPGICSWDGDYWRRQPLIWGYSSDYGEFEIANDVAAGDRDLTFSQAAADEVWVIDTFIAWADQGNPTTVEFMMYAGGAEQVVGIAAYPVAFLSVSPVTPLHVPPDGYLKVRFKDCVAGDDIRASATGYKMKIAE